MKVYAVDIIFHKLSVNELLFWIRIGGPIVHIDYYYSAVSINSFINQLSASHIKRKA